MSGFQLSGDLHIRHYPTGVPASRTSRDHATQTRRPPPWSLSLAPPAAPPTLPLVSPSDSPPSLVSLVVPALPGSVLLRSLVAESVVAAPDDAPVH